MSISTCAEGFAEGDFNFKMFLVAKKVLKSERGGTVHPITPSQGLEGVNVKLLDAKFISTDGFGFLF